MTSSLDSALCGCCNGLRGVTLGAEFHATYRPRSSGHPGPSTGRPVCLLLGGIVSKSSANIFVRAGRASRTRRGLAFAATAGLTVGLSLLASPSAMATLSPSTFQGNDGNLIVDTGADVTGTTDWANVAGLHTGPDAASGSADNAFGQGTKEDNSNVTVVNGSIPPNKNDLTWFDEASQTFGSGSGASIFAYLGWERLVNIGNANLDFELNQAKTTGLSGAGKVTINRTAGDLLITYDFAGSGTPTLGLLTWLDGTEDPAATKAACFAANALPCWGSRVDLSAAGFAEGNVNTSTFNDTLNSNINPLGVGLFGEASVNLSAAGVFSNGCKAFGSIFVKSRASSSFGAELKDFIAPVAVDINNCVKSHMTSDQSFYPNDSATITAASGGLAGTVTFKLYESANCSGNAKLTETQTFSLAAVADVAPSKTVGTTNTSVSTTAANVSWLVSYASTDTLQSIAATCLEKTTLTYDNGGTVDSP